MMIAGYHAFGRVGGTSTTAAGTAALQNRWSKCGTAACLMT